MTVQNRTALCDTCRYFTCVCLCEWCNASSAIPESLPSKWAPCDWDREPKQGQGKLKHTCSLLICNKYVFKASGCFIEYLNIKLGWWKGQKLFLFILVRFFFYLNNLITAKVLFWNRKIYKVGSVLFKYCLLEKIHNRKRKFKSVYI